MSMLLFCSISMVYWGCILSGIGCRYGLLETQRNGRRDRGRTCLASSTGSSGGCLTRQVKCWTKEFLQISGRLLLQLLGGIYNQHNQRIWRGISYHDGARTNRFRLRWYTCTGEVYWLEISSLCFSVSMRTTHNMKVWWENREGEQGEN